MQMITDKKRKTIKLLLTVMITIFAVPIITCYPGLAQGKQEGYNAGIMQGMGAMAQVRNMSRKGEGEIQVQRIQAPAGKNTTQSLYNLNKADDRRETNGPADNAGLFTAPVNGVYYLSSFGRCESNNCEITIRPAGGATTMLREPPNVPTRDSQLPIDKSEAEKNARDGHDR